MTVAGPPADLHSVIGPVAPEVLDRAGRVRLVVFDVDGTLTDGRLFLGEGGAEFKVFDARDGQGVVMLRSSGVEVAIITGRSSPVVAERMAALGVHHVHQGRHDKAPVWEQLRRDLGIAPEEAAYVGDDLPDLTVMTRVGLAVAVADAHPLVRQHAHHVTVNPGGRGAAREVCELVMWARGSLAAAFRQFLPAGG